MALPPKVCPDCGEEYVHSASKCVHCDVDLVLHEELRDRPEAGLPPVAELHCLRTCQGDWAVGLSERLRDAAIPHRVDRVATNEARGVHVYAVWIRPEDLSRAWPLDHQFASEQIPDLPEGIAGEYGEAQPHAAGGATCPACGDPVAPDHAECAGCGLFLGEPE